MTFTDNERKNVRVFTSEVGWKQAIVHARNFKLEYGLANSYKSLFSVVLGAENS